MTTDCVLHVPTPAEMEQAKVCSRTLAKFADAEHLPVTLHDDNGESDCPSVARHT